jgi:hypothetical protein
MGMLQRVFGPSRQEIWRQLSEQMNARYVSGGWAKSDRVEVDHGDWTVTLDTYVVSTGKTVIVFTRMRAPYVNPGGFRFMVYRKSIFTGIAKFFGMQDIEIGHPPFDHDFVVQSSNESKVRELLANSTIRDLITRQKDIQFSVKDDEGWFGSKFPDGVDELHFTVVGIIKDIDRLKLLYDLFAETLEHLCRMGVAEKRRANVELK